MKRFNKLFIIISLTVIFLLTGCSNSKNNPTNTASGTNNVNSDEEVETKDLEKKITCSGEVAKNGKLIVFAKNSNKVAVDMEIEVEFYTKDGKVAGNDRRNLTAVGSNSEIATEMSSTPDSWDNYKIYVDVKKSNGKTYFKDLEISHNKNGEEIIVQVKNNSQETVEDLSIAVVFYKNKKAVGIGEDSEIDIKSGRSGNFTIDFPYDKNYDDVSFDSYKVFVTEAYTYN